MSTKTDQLQIMFCVSRNSTYILRIRYSWLFIFACVSRVFLHGKNAIYTFTYIHQLDKTVLILSNTTSNNNSFAAFECPKYLQRQLVAAIGERYLNFYNLIQSVNHESMNLSLAIFQLGCFHATIIPPMSSVNAIDWWY